LFMKSGQKRTTCLFNSPVTFSALAVIFIALSLIRADLGDAAQKDARHNIFTMAMNRPEDDFSFKWCKLIYTEAFRRLGYQLTLKYYPLTRASVMADSGKVDGEPVRIHSYALSHPNLVRVNEPVYSANILAFTTLPNLTGLNGWNSLQGKTYLIGYPRGSKICHDNLIKAVRPEFLSTCSDASLGLKKLLAGRTDIYMDGDIVTFSLLQSPQFKTPPFDGSTVRVAGKMETIPLFGYLHKRHAALAKQLADIIQAMKMEGLIEQFRERAGQEIGTAEE
jgi:polar amino acid transport system substrate-binding protein